MSVPIFSVITNPRAFFEELAGEPANLTRPALIVLLQGILGSISGYVLGDKIGQLTVQVTPELANLGSIFVIFSVVGAIIGAFFFWGLMAAIFYLISMVFKGVGGFSRTLEFVGYGSIPLAIGSLISGVILLIYAPDIAVPVITDPNDLPPAITALMREPVLLLSNLIGVIVMVWSANIWIFALRVARKLPTRDAAVTVVVPVVLFLLYEVYNLGFFS